MDNFNVFNEKFYNLIKDGIQFVQLQSPITEEVSADKVEWTPYKTTTNLSCSYCRMVFETLTQQREHYKLDWHRYNLKQHLLSKLPISEEEFSNKDDLSSISGSNSSDEDTVDTIASAQGKIFLKTLNGFVFSMYKCLIAEKKEELKDDNDLLTRLISVNQNLQWTVLMLGGGHFAGAIFNGNEPILHKTFHSYTVRQGQGGSQSSRDNKNATGQPKSAGSSLRRYNETAFIQHVTDIVDLWRMEIERSHLILYRASGPYNRSILFGGKTPLLNRNDCRLRTIPFSTRRATFNEVKRVHEFLSNIYVYSSVELASKKFITQKSPEQVKAKKAVCLNRSKSRERTRRPDPFPKEAELEIDSNNEIAYKMEDLEINFHEELKAFDDSLTREERRATSPKKNAKKSKTLKKEKPDEEIIKQRRYLCNLIKMGNVEDFQKLLDIEDNEKRTKLINDGLDDKQNTPLHIAAIHEQLDFISFLLQNDADVCAKNEKNFTPYTCMQHKEVRDLFKDFAQKNPDKYNYNKANIPITLLTVEEQAEKKRMQRKIKRDKDKEKKREKEMQKQEQLEKDRFLSLSDREKRALAAERRILKEATVPIILTRCFLCGIDISGKVPFEYSGNRFCSIDCLKAHRLRNCVKL